MASTTKDADSEGENIYQNLGLNSNTEGKGTRKRGIHINSANSGVILDVSNKEGLRRRAILSQEQSGKKRKSFVKKFRKEWMDEPIFRGWLQPIPNVTENELEKHASGKKHSDLMLMHSIKGELMDSTNILDVDMDEMKSKEDSMDSTDLTGEPVLQLAQDDSGDSHLVFHVTQDGTLVEMNMEDYEKIAAGTHKLERTTTKTTHGLSNAGSKGQRGNRVLNIGATTITKQHSTRPAILRTSKPTVKMQPIKPELNPVRAEGKPTRLALETARDLQELRDTLRDSSETDDDEDLNDSHQMIKEMKAEAAYNEKRLIEQKRGEPTRKADWQGGSADDLTKHLAEKELEVKLHHLQERRRQRFNLYKLKLQEMDARVRVAEAELVRGEELHKLRIKHLQLQIMQQEQYGQQEMQ